MDVYDDENGIENPLTPDDRDHSQGHGENQPEEDLRTRFSRERLARRESMAQRHDENTEGLNERRSENQSKLSRAGKILTHGALGAAEAGDKVGKGFTDETDGEDKSTGLRAKAKNFAKSHKKALIGGAFAGIGLLAGIAILIFIIGTLLIPDFATHITEYQFARVARSFQDDTDAVTKEKLAADAAEADVADPSIFDSIKSTFQDVRDNTWGKFDQYRPDKVMESLQSVGDDSPARLSFEYNEGVLGRQTIKGVTFDGASYELNSSFLDGVFHPIQTFQNQVQLASDFSAAFNDGLRDDTGILIRGAVENQIRQELGISLFAWVVGKYQGKSQADAEAQAEQDSFKAVDDPSAVDSSNIPALDQAAEGTASAEQACVEDAKCLAETVANNGAEPATAVAAAESSITAGILNSSIVKFFAGPVVTIGLPACIIYSGSLQKSQPTIDSQDTEAQRTYYLIASAADQQKAGSPYTNAEAVGAFNWKLNADNNISQSIPEQRAAGDQVDTTADQLSPQASGTGQFTIFDALLGSGLSGILDSIANTVCPVITSPEFVVGSIAAQLAALVFSGGSEEGLEASFSKVVGEIVTKFTTVDGLKDFIGKGVAIGAGVAILTLLAKAVVTSSAGSRANGLATGVPFDNVGDEGGNLNANQDMQEQFYGAPMTNADTAQSDQQDLAYLQSKTQSQSAYQRYFAVSNADSLVTKMGTTVLADMNSSVFSSFFATVGKLFNPLLMLPKIFSSLNTKAVFAAGATDNQHYGIVQWGWTAAEQNLMNTDTSYQPLENAKVFTDEANDYSASHNGADMETAIENKYGKCFTDSMGTLLSGSDNGGNPEIVRDSNGDVTGGLCSGQNLSFGNNEFEPQAVFRWRVLHYYNAGLDQLTQVQNAGSSS